MLERISRDGRGIACRVRDVLLLDWGLDTAPDDAVVRAASSALAACGRDARVEGAPYGTDASKIARRARVPAIVLGPGDIAQAHTDDEWIADRGDRRRGDRSMPSWPSTSRGARHEAVRAHLPDRLGQQRVLPHRLRSTATST